VVTQTIQEYGASVQQQRQALEGAQRQTQQAQLQFSRQQLAGSSPIQRQEIVPQFEEAKAKALEEIKTGLEQQTQIEKQFAPIKAAYETQVAEQKQRDLMELEASARHTHKELPQKVQPSLSKENIAALEKHIQETGRVEPALQEALGIEIDQPMTVRTTLIPQKKITTGLTPPPKIDWSRYLADVSKSIITPSKIIGPPSQINLLSTMANLPSPQQVIASSLTVKQLEQSAWKPIKTITEFEKISGGSYLRGAGLVARGISKDIKGGTKAFAGIVTEKLVKPAVMRIPEEKRIIISERGKEFGTFLMGASVIAGKTSYETSGLKSIVKFMGTVPSPQQGTAYLINKPMPLSEYKLPDKVLEDVKTISVGNVLTGGKQYKPLKAEIPIITPTEKAYLKEVSQGREPGRTRFFIEKLAEGYGQATTGLAETYFQAKQGKYVSPFIAAKQPTYQFLPQSRIVGGVGKMVGAGQLYFIPVVGKTLIAAPFMEAAGRKELGSYIVKHPFETALATTILVAPIIKYAKEPVFEKGWISKPQQQTRFGMELKKVKVGDKKEWFAQIRTQTTSTPGKAYIYSRPRYQSWISEITGKAMTPSQVLKLTPSQLKAGGISLKIKEYAPREKIITTDPFRVKKPTYIAEEYTQGRRIPKLYKIEPVKGKSIFLRTDEGIQFYPKVPAITKSTKFNVVGSYKKGTKPLEVTFDFRTQTPRKVLLKSKLKPFSETEFVKTYTDRVSVVPITKTGRVKILGTPKDLISKDYQTMTGKITVYKEATFIPTNTYTFSKLEGTRVVNMPIIKPDTSVVSNQIKVFSIPKVSPTPSVSPISPISSTPQIMKTTTKALPKNIGALVKNIPLPPIPKIISILPVAKTTTPTTTDIISKVLTGTKAISMQIPKPIIKTNQIDKNIFETKIETDVTTIPKIIPSLSTPSIQTPQQKQEQNQIPKLVNIPLPIVSKPTPSQTPTENIPRYSGITLPPIFAPIPKGETKKIKKKEKIQKILRYVPYVKRKGKYVPVGLPTGLEKAKAKGISILRTTLAASLQIRTTEGKKIAIGTESKIFRPGSKGRDMFTLVQKRGARLGTKAETSALVLSRRKGGLKFI